MTTYCDIYQDLPLRVHKVWQRAIGTEADAAEDLSVTAMLMAAAAGLAMPFENLKKEGAANGNGWKNHPAFNTTRGDDYKAAIVKFSAFFRKPLSECVGLQDASLMHCQKLDSVREAATQGHGDAALDVSRHDIRFGIRILRNALAHNNLFSLPQNNGGQIEKLVFFASSGWHTDNAGEKGWYVLVVQVDNFKAFLNEWFKLMTENCSVAAAGEAFAGAEGGRASGNRTRGRKTT